MARPSALTVLLGLAVVLARTGCDARRVQVIAQRHDTVKEVTPSEPIDLGGWRPVLDSRYDANRPQLPDGYTIPQSSNPSGSKDQTADLIPPPHRSTTKQVLKKIKPTRKPLVKGPEVSESRVTPSGYAHSTPEGPSRPMRFPDEKRRNNVQVRRQRPSPHHHHYHVRQTPYAGSESTQQLRFRPSPQAPAAYENSYPGWLLQNDEQSSQQQQVFYNPENGGLVQLQQYTPDAQLQLALAQQQPDVAQQYPQQSHHHSGFLPGTQQIFGNAGLFNLHAELQKDANPHNNLFIIPAATEPSVQENEVPQGPQVFMSHTTRGRPSYESTDVPKFPHPEISVYQPENSDLRPRRPRPPTGIQAQLEGHRRPIKNDNDDNIRNRPDDDTNFRPRHPRPPSTEPPSWSHPVQELDPSIRLRRPRPTQQTQFENSPESAIEPRRPRPPQQVQDNESINPEVHRIRRPRPPAQQEQQQQSWRPSPEHPDDDARPQEQSETQEKVRPQRPRFPPPVQEEFDDDAAIVRPVFSVRPRPRPQQQQPEEPAQTEDEPQKIVRPVEEESFATEKSPTQDQNNQEDVDDSVNVRPRRPRPPEDEERPRPRRPRPPQDGLRRRRPRPPVSEDEETEQPRRRRPQRPTEIADDEERKQRRPVRPWKASQQQDEVESEIKPDESIPEESVREEILPEDNYPNYQNFPEVVPENEEQILVFPTNPSLPETTLTPSTTHPTLLVPSIPPKRRRPPKVEEEPEIIERIPETTENYPPQFRVTTEAATTPAPTTTLPPTTTYSVINSRLKARLNATRQRFSVSRLSTLNAKRNNNKNEESTTETPSASEDTPRVRQRTRESSRFRTSSTTTEQPNVERTTFKPAVTRFPRPGNKFYSRYRAGNNNNNNDEQQETTTAQQDATRRTNQNIYSINKERRKLPLRYRNDDSGFTEQPVTSEEPVAEITTISPSEDVEMTTFQEEHENEVSESASEDTEETTEVPTTSSPDIEPESTTPAEDFSPAKRVTDLTSSATAFKPLSFFSAVPADGKHASQLSSRFTMATEDPILPLEAFFPTYTTKSRQQDEDE